MNAKTNAESSITDQGNRARRLLSCFVIFLTISILLNSSVFTSYASQTTPVIKIGFPNQAGSSYIDERGNYAGYLVDYLHQLDMFTDWDIEFIQVEGDSDTQLSTLMDMLMDGEIDIMGTMNRNTQLEEFFLYPNYSYGTSYTTLAVLDDDLRWIEDDCANWNDIRVATYPGYESRMKEFRYYAQANRFTYEVVECDSYDDMAQAVRNGEADAMIQSDLSLVNGFRVIGRFSPAPYYFAVSKDNTDLLQQLDSAMRSLNSSQPNLQSELYDLYFRHTGEFQISQSHLDYIHSLGTLKVLFFDGNAPYQYINKEGKLTGFVVEYWKNFADATGLQYEPVIVSTYPEAVELIENGQIDIVACVPTNSTLSSLDAVRFSLPYFNSFSVSAYPDSKSHKPSSDLKFRTNTEIALNEIQHEDKYGVQLDYYSLSFYLRKDSVYDSVAVDWSDTKNFSYVSGITGDVPDDFVTILNQYITSVKDDTMQTLLYRYSSDDIEYTFSEWIYSHRILIACALAVTIILACLCWITWRNNRLRYKTLLAENRLAQLTMYDSTTGAYNESQFRKLLEECCKKKENIALIALNIRGFK